MLSKDGKVISHPRKRVKEKNEHVSKFNINLNSTHKMFICLFIPNIAMGSSKNPILVDQGSPTEVDGFWCLVQI